MVCRSVKSKPTISAKLLILQNFKCDILKLMHQSVVTILQLKTGERGGSVVECRTPEREVGGSIPTAAVLCP